MAVLAAFLTVGGFLIPSSIGEYLSVTGLAGLLWLVARQTTRSQEVTA
jgi:hypothetical protein